MIRCFGRGYSRLLGVTVWFALMAAVYLRMPNHLQVGPLAAVFVFAAPCCWFLGVLVAAVARSLEARVVGARLRHSMRVTALAPLERRRPDAGTERPTTGSSREPSAGNSPGGAALRRRWDDPPEHLGPSAPPRFLVGPDPGTRRQGLGSGDLIEVPKPFAEMSASELDAWVAAAADTLIARASEPGRGEQPSS